MSQETSNVTASTAQTPVGRLNAAVWFEIAVADMARARAFYETILAAKLVTLPNPEFEMVMFPLDDPQGSRARSSAWRVVGRASAARPFTSRSRASSMRCWPASPRPAVK